MCVKRDRADSATFGGKLYVVGGSYGNVVVDSVECYDPAIDKWKISTYLPHPRHGFRCCTAVVNRDLIQEVQAGKPADRSEQLI
jgi:N-acetylneuraminic acid mutarotase